MIPENSETNNGNTSRKSPNKFTLSNTVLIKKTIFAEVTLGNKQD